MHEFLIEKLKTTYGESKINEILDGLSLAKKTSFRVNTIKSSIDEIEKILIENSIKYEKYKDLDNVILLEPNSEDLLSKLDIYKDGKIYLQSISSMMPVYVLEPKENENILDMCAAPGGKTTLISAFTNNKSNVTAVELHKDRFERLKYNVSLQGANAYLLNINAIDLDNNLKFDKILLDAPCSGSGVLNINDDKYKSYFTNTLIEKCIKIQKKLITKASKILKKGGILVYSTCSLLKEENENIIDFALLNGFQVDEKYFELATQKLGVNSLDKSASIEKDYIKIYPSETYEGFFVTRFIKN